LPALNRFKNISIVVNNAGVDILGKFTSLTAQKVADLTTLNCFSLAAVCHKFIPYFEARTKETGLKCGFINVGSVAGTFHRI
jgi:short-subunit dehydrogenase